MAKKKATEEKLPAIPAASNVPAFMQNATDMGTEALKDFVVPPRLKIVQKQSGEQYEQYRPGACLLMPQMVELADQGEAFHFVPLFFFPEWCLWNPLEMKGSLDMIRERTLDPKSDMVAKSRDPERRTIPCPENEKYECRFVEHLNFVVMPIGHPGVENMLVNISFGKAEHRTGTTLSGLIQMRHAPIYGCQFEARTSQRQNAMGSWWGLDIGQPSLESDVPPFVQDEAVFEQYYELHKMLKSKHNDSLLQVDYEDSVIDTTATEPTEY